MVLVLLFSQFFEEKSVAFAVRTEICSECAVFLRHFGFFGFFHGSFVVESCSKSKKG
jgi:hypothetical protein